MSRRAAAVVLVVVGLLAALVIPARLNPVYQSRALVSLGVIASTGPASLEQQLALARSRTVQVGAQARLLGATTRAQADVVGGSAIEFRARSENAREAAAVANAYADTYVEVRGKQPPEVLRSAPPALASPHVVVRAQPARSPLPPWPSETWTLAGMVLLALALAVPGPQPPSGVEGTERPAG